MTGIAQQNSSDTIKMYTLILVLLILWKIDCQYWIKYVHASTNVLKFSLPFYGTLDMKFNWNTESKFW